MSDLSEQRLKKMLSFIVSYKEMHDGNSPSIRNIGDALGIHSTSLIHYYLQTLEKEGYIRTTERQTRSIEVVHPVFKDSLKKYGAYER